MRSRLFLLTAFVAVAAGLGTSAPAGSRTVLAAIVLALVVVAGCRTQEEAGVEVEADSVPTTGSPISVTRVGGPTVLNTSGRAVFANVLLLGNDEVLVTYQIANFETISDDKSLYFRRFNRAAGLESLLDERVAIDVSDGVFRGDLGDHKFVMVADGLAMVTLLREREQVGLLKYSLEWELQTPEPVLIGDPSTTRFLDMGFGSDGSNLYATFFYQPSDDLAEWRTQIFKLSTDLEVIAERAVRPENSTPVTGTAIVYVPAGQMGAETERLQVFTTNDAFGAAGPVGIQTFAVRPSDMSLIEGSTRLVIGGQPGDLDVYFSVGPSWNAKHQVWVVGYTQEQAFGAHGGPDGKELGPVFIDIFDASWTRLDRIELNDGGFGMRVMTQTAGDDIYVVYDEMAKDGSNATSAAKLEMFRIEGG